MLHYFIEKDCKASWIHETRKANHSQIVKKKMK